MSYAQADVARIEMDSYLELRNKLQDAGLLDTERANQLVANLTSPVLQRVLAQESHKQKNVDSVFQQALPDIDPQADPSKVDEGIMWELLDKFSKVSNKEMQAIWAKILAGEINSPGSFSASTIDLVSKMSKSDAEDFLRVCSLTISIGGSKIPFFHDILKERDKPNGLIAEILWNLERLGLLLYRPAGNGRWLNAHKESILAVTQGNRGFRMEFSQGQNIPYGEVYFTRPGLELASICKPIPSPTVLEEARQYWIGQSRSVSEIYPYPDHPAFTDTIPTGLIL